MGERESRRRAAVNKNVLIAVAMSALLMTFGVVVGRQTLTEQPEPVAQPRPQLEHEMPTLGANPDEAEDLDAMGALILERLTRMEQALDQLQKQQAALAERLDDAGEIVEWLNKMRPAAEKSRERAHQTAAIATLRNVTSAQAQLQASARVDTDADGTGEYGGFREMSGDVPGRMSKKLVPPVLSSAFRKLNEFGEATRSGYHYRFYLPGPGGEGIGEPQDGFSSSSGIDAQLAESTWCCYAWPVDDKSGNDFVFFMNQAGDVLGTNDARYRGAGNGPEPDAAFLQGGSIVGRTAVGRRGQDGNTWRQVN